MKQFNLSRDYEQNPLKRGELPEKEDIEFLFLDCNYSRQECATICNCTEEKVKKVINFYKLKKTSEQRIACRNRTNLIKYGVSNVSQLEKVKNKKKETTFKHYGVYNPAQSKEVYQKIKETCMDRYGVESTNMLQEKKDAIKNTIQQKYGVDNVMQVSEIQNKVDDCKRDNDTFNTSMPEEIIFNLLTKRFRIIRQYKSEKYPFKCDFYLPELDLYIEYHGSWTHGKVPFEDNEYCREKLKRWEKKAETSDFYKSAIETWTIRDVRKRQTAEQNNLNWICFYNENEFMEWFQQFDLK